MNVDERLQRLLDHHEIQEVLLRYCRGVDRCDAALVASAYHDDAVDNHGPYQGSGSSQLAAEMVTILRRDFIASRHDLGNHLIEVVNDRAVSECHFVSRMFFERDGRTLIRVHGGRYLDRLERRDGTWGIVSRVVVSDWSRVDESDRHSTSKDALLVGFVQGDRHPNDMIYRMLADLDTDDSAPSAMVPGSGG